MLRQPGVRPTRTSDMPSVFGPGKAATLIGTAATAMSHPDPREDQIVGGGGGGRDLAEDLDGIGVGRHPCREDEDEETAPAHCRPATGGLASLPLHLRFLGVARGGTWESMVEPPFTWSLPPFPVVLWWRPSAPAGEAPMWGREVTLYYI